MSNFAIVRNGYSLNLSTVFHHQLIPQIDRTSLASSNTPPFLSPQKVKEMIDQVLQFKTGGKVQSLIDLYESQQKLQELMNFEELLRADPDNLPSNFHSLHQDSRHALYRLVWEKRERFEDASDPEFGRKKLESDPQILIREGILENLIQEKLKAASLNSLDLDSRHALYYLVWERNRYTFEALIDPEFGRKKLESDPQILIREGILAKLIEIGFHAAELFIKLSCETTSEESLQRTFRQFCNNPCVSHFSNTVLQIAQVLPDASIIENPHLLLGIVNRKGESLLEQLAKDPSMITRRLPEDFGYVKQEETSSKNVSQFISAYYKQVCDTMLNTGSHQELAAMMVQWLASNDDNPEFFLTVLKTTVQNTKDARPALLLKFFEDLTSNHLSAKALVNAAPTWMPLVTDSTLLAEILKAIANKPVGGLGLGNAASIWMPLVTDSTLLVEILKAIANQPLGGLGLGNAASKWMPLVTDSALLAEILKAIANHPLGAQALIGTMPKWMPLVADSNLLAEMLKAIANKPKGALALGSTTSQWIPLIRNHSNFVELFEIAAPYTDINTLNDTASTLIQSFQNPEKICRFLKTIGNRFFDAQNLMYDGIDRAVFFEKLLQDNLISVDLLEEILTAPKAFFVCTRYITENSPLKEPLKQALKKAQGNADVPLYLFALSTATAPSHFQRELQGLLGIPQELFQIPFPESLLERFKQYSKLNVETLKKAQQGQQLPEPTVVSLEKGFDKLFEFIGRLADFSPLGKYPSRKEEIIQLARYLDGEILNFLLDIFPDQKEPLRKLLGQTLELTEELRKEIENKDTSEKRNEALSSLAQIIHLLNETILNCHVGKEGAIGQLRSALSQIKFGEKSLSSTLLEILANLKEELVLETIDLTNPQSVYPKVQAQTILKSYLHYPVIATETWKQTEEIKRALFMHLYLSFNLDKVSCQIRERIKNEEFDVLLTIELREKLLKRLPTGFTKEQWIALQPKERREKLLEGMKQNPNGEDLFQAKDLEQMESVEDYLPVVKGMILHSLSFEESLKCVEGERDFGEKGADVLRMFELIDSPLHS